MALVSGLYRMVPSEWSGSQDERRVRMQRALKRLTDKMGRAAVEQGLKDYKPVTMDEAVLQAILLKKVS